eukprot:399932_1
MGNCCSSTDQPTTPISVVLTRIAEKRGIEKHKEYANKLADILRKQWYYRAFDLMEIDKETWDSLHLSVVFGNKINEYNNRYRNTMFGQFNEPYTNTNDMRLILNALRYENNIDSAIEDINKIDNKCKSLFLYNTIKFKQHFSENDFDELDVPIRLKIILSRKLNISYKEYNINNREYILVEQSETSVDTHSISHTTQFQKQFDGTTSTDAICFVLAQILLTDDIDYIKQMLSPLFDLKYNRMYHLSTINQNIFNELLINVPSCLRITLWKMIQRIGKEYSNGFPFYNDQKRQTSAINSTSKRYNNIDTNKLKLAMKTTDVFSLLEHDMNLSYNELKKDCDILMNKFYCNLWDWFFIPMEIWNECPYYKSY